MKSGFSGIFGAVFLIASTAFSASAETSSIDLSQLARSDPWLRLLHYKHTFPFGSLKSEAQPGPFFFAPNGNRDPEAELRASIAAFTASSPALIGPHHLHPQCAMPARYHFLKSKLGWKIADVPCPELETFLKKLGADGLSLVFSSAYPNSPPSMFGHTLLRVHSAARSELLDYSINYSAVSSPDENTIAFAVLGLTGGYYGQFGVEPYYMKVNEYNHAESRDLWEYELNLSKEEIRILLWHVWELDQTASFRYYFFDENCSYRLLTLLEVAKPEWKLSQFAVDVIPADTVKRVAQTPGAIRAIRHRLSLRQVMRKRFDALSASARAKAFQLVAGELEASGVSESGVLDAANSFFQYRRLLGLNHLSEEDQKRFNSILLARAKLGVRTEEAAETETGNRPDLGHDSYLLRAGGGAFNQLGKTSSYTELHFKTAYHDLLNNPVGYEPFSQVDFPEISLRYSPDLHSLWIERLGVVNVISLAPMTDLEKHPSWKLDLSYISPKDLNCENCHAVMLEGGAGATGTVFSERAIFYGMGLLHWEAGSSIENGVRFVPKLLAATLVRPFEGYRTQLSGDIAWDVWQSARQSRFYELEWTHSLSLSRNWELRANAKGVIPGNRQENVIYREFGIHLDRYF